MSTKSISEAIQWNLNRTKYLLSDEDVRIVESYGAKVSDNLNVYAKHYKIKITSEGPFGFPRYTDVLCILMPNGCLYDKMRINPESLYKSIQNMIESDKYQDFPEWRL
jgi:hypothetical protein